MNKGWRDGLFVPARDALYNHFSFVHFGVAQQPSRTFRDKPPITEKFKNTLKTAKESCNIDTYLKSAMKGNELTKAKLLHELKK